MFNYFAGVVVGGGRDSRLQTPETEAAQLHDTPLFAVQGGLGLGDIDIGDVHGHIHAVRGRVSAQRTRREQEKQQEV